MTKKVIFVKNYVTNGKLLMMVMMIKLVFKIVKSLKQVQTRPAYLRRGIAGTCLLPDFIGLVA